MFGLGGQELLLILFIILLFFGPQKLPELARSFGKGMREFKKAQDEIEAEFNKAVESEPAKIQSQAPVAVESEQMPETTASAKA
jgi:sec-independent protein translocase protein TatA